MAALRFASTSTLPLSRLTAIFNSVYEGYAHPVSMTVETLARVVRVENTDLHASVLAYAVDPSFGNDPVGLALIGIRGTVARVSAFGLATPARCKKLGAELIEEAVSRAREMGATMMRLEVLDSNLAAIKVYEKAGFRRERDLGIFDRNSVSNVAAPTSPNGQVDAVISRLIAANFLRLHSWRAAWQRDLPQIINSPGIGSIIEGDPAHPSAYAALLPLPDGSFYIYDLAATDSSSADRLCAKIAAMSGHYRVVNEPQDSPFYASLARHGFTMVDRQYEMGMKL